ncbi:MAG: TatA [Peptococcaceae bacterium]|nr:TatA [Peptococcaceae bacterium]
MNLTDIILILIVALILFGPEDLPVVARAIGKIVYRVRKMSSELGREFQEAINAPANVINDSLKDTFSESDKKEISATGKELNHEQETSELLTYVDSKSVSEDPDDKKNNNPLAELPTDMISREVEIK